MKLSYLLIYLFAICLMGFLLMGIDKWKARRERYRIPEAALFLTAFLGGAAGCWLGMQVFRHKTKHWYFKYGLPMMTLFQATLLAAFIYWDAFLRA